MATRFINRGIEEITYTVLFFNAENNSTEIKTFALGKMKSDEKALAAIKEKVDTDTVKAVYIIGKSEPVTRKYRLTEDAFTIFGELVTEDTPSDTNSRYITRTIETSVYDVLFFNTENRVSFISECVCGKTRNDSETLETIRKSCDTDTIKAVYLVGLNHTDTLKYRMTEQDFVKYGELVTDFDTDTDTDN